MPRIKGQVAKNYHKVCETHINNGREYIDIYPLLMAMYAQALQDIITMKTMTKPSYNSARFVAPQEYKTAEWFVQEFAIDMDLGERDILAEIYKYIGVKNEN